MAWWQPNINLKLTDGGGGSSPIKPVIKPAVKTDPLPAYSAWTAPYDLNPGQVNATTYQPVIYHEVPEPKPAIKTDPLPALPQWYYPGNVPTVTNPSYTPIANPIPGSVYSANMVVNPFYRNYLDYEKSNTNPFGYYISSGIPKDRSVGYTSPTYVPTTNVPPTPTVWPKYYTPYNGSTSWIPYEPAEDLFDITFDTVVPPEGFYYNPPPTGGGGYVPGGYVPGGYVPGGYTPSEYDHDYSASGVYRPYAGGGSGNYASRADYPSQGYKQNPDMYFQQLAKWVI